MNKIKGRIIIGSYMFRYPLGGMLSWVLQYLTGFKKLGFDVYFVEKYGYPDSCYDPVKEIMSDDCSYGLKMVSNLMENHGFHGKWCFMDINNTYYGLSKNEIEALFKTAELFIDMGTHGAWMEEASSSTKTLLLDGEPGFTQIKMANHISDGGELPIYDMYFTTGQNIGKKGNHIPTLDINWHHIFHPVDVDLFDPAPTARKHKFTTIMNWKSHEPIQYNGTVYGQKNIEFNKITELPKTVDVDLEIAISGKKVPGDWLTDNGWQLKSGKEITQTFESFREYINYSSGEFSICKNVFVSAQTGWFSDKSAAYLACSKPVILQDTGFSRHLPCGEGLHAFDTIDEAKSALENVTTNYAKNSNAALEIAYEHLSTHKVLNKLLNDVGI